jgi:hypothetical protein
MLISLCKQMAPKFLGFFLQDFMTFTSSVAKLLHFDAAPDPGMASERQNDAAPAPTSIF